MLTSLVFFSSVFLSVVDAVPYPPSNQNGPSHSNNNNNNGPSYNRGSNNGHQGSNSPPTYGLGGPNTVYTPYCVGSSGSCCYVGDQAIPPCFWDQGNMTGYLQDFVSNHPSIGQKQDSWVDTLWITAGLGQNPQCTIDTGCLAPQYGADGTNGSEVKAVVAANAISKWMTYQKVNHDTLANTMNTFISQNLTDILNDFGAPKHSGPDAWPDISDGLAIAGAVLGLITAPLTDGISLGAGIAAFMGVAGGAGNLIDAVGNESPAEAANFKQIKNYFQWATTSWASYIEGVAGNFTSDFDFAINILNANDQGGMWSSPTTLATQNVWNHPQAQVDRLTPMLQHWAIMKVLQAQKIFIHMESSSNCNPFNDNFPGHACFSGYSDSVVSNLGAYLFPVQYSIKDGGTPFNLRDYPQAPNIGNYPVPGTSGTMDWEQIAIGAYECQYHYQPTNGLPTGNATYPPANLTTLFSIIDANSGNTNPIVPKSIPCFYNVPICNAMDSHVVTGCTGNQDCCTGSGAASGSTGGRYGWNGYADNNGLDDWCAGALGLPSYGHSYYPRQGRGVSCGTSGETRTITP